MRNISKLPNCPYCGLKLYYVEALATKSKSLFKCPRCKKKSEIDLKPILLQFLGATQIISLFIFIFSIFSGSKYCFLGLIFITLVFMIFYTLSPFMIGLKTSNKKEKIQKPQKKNTIQESEFEKDKKNQVEEIFSN